MVFLSLGGSKHEFKKVNLVTQSDKRGMYDEYRCNHCGLIGKSRSLGVVAVTKDKKCAYIKPAQVISEIEIISCNAVGPIFKNIIPNSKHKVVVPPPGYLNDDQGVWVMGVGEPVKVLNYEFKIVK